MTINPEVRIDVDRDEMVVGLDGVNDDGADLISGYVYDDKSLELVMDELVDRAIEMGYLSERRHDQSHARRRQRRMDRQP